MREMGPNLEVDIGNSYCKWRLRRAGEASVFGGIAVAHLAKVIDSAVSWQSDVTVSALFAPLRETAVAKVDICSVASVEINRLLADIIEQLFAVKADFLVVTSERAGLKNSYQQPEKMGADRWLASIAAHHLYPKTELCVVDCGTAINVEFIGAGQHRGGYILPGVDMMQRSLLANTALVKQSSSQVSIDLGKETGTNVANGSYYLVLAVLEKLQREMQAKNGMLIITGGTGKVFEPYLCADNLVFLPELIFDGFRFLSSK